MPTADEINEQATAAILERIVSAPTVSGKVRELIHALDWMKSIPVDSRGAQPGRLTRFQQIFEITAVAWFISAVGRNDLAQEFQEIASTLSDLDRGIVRPSAKKGPRTGRGGPIPRGSNVWRARAYAAVAIDTMHKAGLQMKDIKRRVDAQPELRLLLDQKKRTGKHTLGDTAEGWREQFGRSAVDNFEAVSTYTYCRALAAKKTTREELMMFADSLLERAISKTLSIKRDSS
jgi:hypothetical protein